jgi:hypothetical protein
MVIKKIETRDYLRTFITRVNKEAGVTFNASKLNNIKECEDYLLNLVKNLRHNKQDNKAYVKEIDSLKEEIEILNTGNKRLESEREFYISEAKEAGEAREKALKDKEYYLLEANLWKDDYFKEKDKHNSTKVRLEDFIVIILVLGLISILEALSIAMLIWK